MPNLVFRLIVFLMASACSRIFLSELNNVNNVLNPSETLEIKDKIYEITEKEVNVAIVVSLSINELVSHYSLSSFCAFSIQFATDCLWDKSEISEWNKSLLVVFTKESKDIGYRNSSKFNEVISISVITQAKYKAQDRVYFRTSEEIIFFLNYIIENSSNNYKTVLIIAGSIAFFAFVVIALWICCYCCKNRYEPPVILRTEEVRGSIASETSYKSINEEAAPANSLGI